MCLYQTNGRISSCIRNLWYCCFALLCCFMTDVTIYHSGKLSSRSKFHHLGLILVFSPSHSFFFSFLIEFLSFFFCVSLRHIVLFHSLLQGTQKLKYPNAALSVILKKKVSYSSDHIKLKLFAECYEYGSRLHPS